MPVVSILLDRFSVLAKLDIQEMERFAKVEQDCVAIHELVPLGML